MHKENKAKSADSRPFVYSPRQFHEDVVEREMSLSGVYAAIRKGEIPSKRIGGRVFIPGDFVDSLRSI